MDKEVAIALNSINKKIELLTKMLENHINNNDIKQSDNLEITNDGVLELAELVSELEEKIDG